MYRLQKEVAILSSLVTYLVFKVIGWLRGMRGFFPDILAISMKKSSGVLCMLTGLYPYPSVLSVVVGYCFCNL